MIDITLLNPQELERFLHLQSLVDRQATEQARVRAYRDYYSGEHPVYLTQRQREFLGPLLSEGAFEWAHNITRSVIDTLRERLDVTGVTVGGQGLDDLEDEADATPEQQAAMLFWDWWKTNRLDSEQITLYRRILRDGAGYLMVDFDDDAGRPRFTVHRKDNGTTGISVHRDPEDENKVLFVNKYWYTYNPLEPGKTGIERKTTYLPGEIRKYERSGKDADLGNWKPVQDGDEPWPIPWTDSSGEPLGIPVFEFANPGGSEITQIIPLQDGLNKSWLDLLAAADAAGFPILAIEYAANGAFNPQTNDDKDIEDDDEFVVAPGRAIEVDDARVHRIEGADLSQLINVIWLHVSAISGISRTPQYYLRPVGGAEVPSGEALKQLESGLVARAEERQLVFGQIWEDVLKMAWKVQQAFGDSLPDVDLQVEVQWADPQPRNDLAAAQEAEAHKRLDVPDEFVWLRLGYTPEQIAQFKQARMAEQAEQVAQIAAAINVEQERNRPQQVPATPQNVRQNGANA